MISLVDPSSFSCFFKLHKLTYLELMSADALSHHIFDLHNNIHPIPKSISRDTINQSYPTYPEHTTLHPKQPRLIRSSKFPRFTTV